MPPASVEEILQRELDQAHAGTHQRQKGEEKRLLSLKATKLKRAEQMKQFRIAAVDARFEEARREVRVSGRLTPLFPAEQHAQCVHLLTCVVDILCGGALCPCQAEEEFKREQSVMQDRLAQELVERQKRTSKIEDMNSLRAMTRRYRQTRNTDPAAAKAVNKREVKGATQAVPLRQGEVEEDFEAMTSLAEHIAPNMETGFMEIEVRARDRQRPVDAVLPKRPLDGTSGKRQRRGDFDMKGKPRAEVSGARITVWYEEEHGGRKMDVPYVGVVNSCDPREGLYVNFEVSFIALHDAQRSGRCTPSP